MSSRALQRKHGVGYRTVAAALDSAWPKPRRLPPKRASRLDQYREVIDAWLREDLDAPRKQRHTAKRIFDRLLDEYDAAGVVSYWMVREYVATRRREIQDLVFPSATGGPMDPNNLGRHFRALCDRAGIGRVRLHDLRHTCASLLLAQNIHPRVVMEILGHSGIAITMDTYSHVLPELQREAADRMDQALGYTTTDDADDQDQDPPEPELGIDRG